MGGGGGSTTTIQKADPWKPAQGALKDVLGAGGALYRKGGFAPDQWTGPTVADMSDATRRANSLIMGMPTDTVSGATGSMNRMSQGLTPYSRLMEDNPMLAAMTKSNPYLARIGNGNDMLSDMQQGRPGVENIAQNGNKWLGRIANGNDMLSEMQGGHKMLTNMARGNDTLEAMGQGDARLAGMTSGQQIYDDLGTVKQNALGSAIPAALSAFTGNGMTDSSAAMDTVGRAATEAVAPIDYQAWQQAQDRALSAIGQDNSTRLAAIGQNDATRMAALNQNDQVRLAAQGQEAQQQIQAALGNDQLRLGAYDQQDRTRLAAQGQEAQQQMQAIGLDAQTRLAAQGQGFQQLLGAYGLQQQGMLGAAGLMPQLQAAGYLPAQMMSQVGSKLDARAQAELEGKIGQYNYGQSQDLNNLLGYAGLAGNIGGLGSTQSSSAPGASGASQFLGAGLGGLGMYGALSMNPVTAPFALAGGIGAGLMGIL